MTVYKRKLCSITEKWCSKTESPVLFLLKILNSFCPGTSWDRGFCPGTFALTLVPGQRDNGTSRPMETLVGMLWGLYQKKRFCLSKSGFIQTAGYNGAPMVYYNFSQFQQCVPYVGQVKRKNTYVSLWLWKISNLHQGFFGRVIHVYGPFCTFPGNMQQ